MERKKNNYKAQAAIEAPAAWQKHKVKEFLAMWNGFSRKYITEKFKAVSSELQVNVDKLNEIDR